MRAYADDVVIFSKNRADAQHKPSPRSTTPARSPALLTIIAKKTENVSLPDKRVPVGATPRPTTSATRAPRLRRERYLPCSASPKSGRSSLAVELRVRWRPHCDKSDLSCQQCCDRPENQRRRQTAPRERTRTTAFLAQMRGCASLLGTHEALREHLDARHNLVVNFCNAQPKQLWITPDAVRRDDGTVQGARSATNDFSAPSPSTRRSRSTMIGLWHSQCKDRARMIAACAGDAAALQALKDGHFTFVNHARVFSAHDHAPQPSTGARLT
jgi:hypothetical protein